MKENRFEKWFHRFASLCSIYSGFTSPSPTGTGTVGRSISGAIGTVLIVLNTHVSSLREGISMPPSSVLIDWVLLGVGVFLLVPSVASLLIGWRRHREQAPVKSEIEPPMPPVITAVRVQDERSPLAVAILRERKSYAISHLLDRQIKNDYEFSRWSGEVKQWRQDIEEDLQRYGMPSDMVYFREQEQKATVTFSSDFRYLSYNDDHNRSRTVLSHWIDVLQLLIRRHEEGMPSYPKVPQ